MENNKRLTLEDIGYAPFFESERERLGYRDLQIARVISEFKGAYKVINADGEYLAKVTGRIMFNASSREDYPAVGDWVVMDDLDGEHAAIRGILPRRTMLSRRFGDKDRSGEKVDVQVIAANVDVAFVVESVDRDYNLNRFERYFAIAESGGVKAAIVLNKTDLLPEGELALRLGELEKRFPGTDVIPASIVNGSSLDLLKGYVRKRTTYCFLGSSGVGKSSLINALIGESSIETGDISGYSGRGKHTTTVRHMYFLKGGGIVVDNPGIREVGVYDAGAGVDLVFDEIAALAEGCRYADCTHMHEPGCEVMKAVRSGGVDEDKYRNFIGLKREAEYRDMDEFEKRERDRRGGKMMKKAKEDLRDIGHKDY